MLMNNKQLLKIMPESTQLPYYVDTASGRVITREASNLPFVYWPNGLPCVEANAYMLKLWSKHLSRRTRGGTIAEYAKNISPIIRFCFNNKINFTELTDNRFTQFINSLNIRTTAGDSIRTTNSILTIGRRTIAFLSFIEEYHFIDNLIGSQGCSIVIESKSFSFYTKSGQNKKLYWHHSSFPQPSPIKSKSPVSIDVVKKLKLSALKTSDKHLRLRRKVMLFAYEITGGRRVEIVHLKVKDIIEALNTNDSSPLLSMFTAKKGKIRKVPVPRGFLQDCMFYVDMSRKRIIRNTIGLNNDHGYLLINHRTGKPLKAETLTGEMNRLCQISNVDTSLGHGHLFRHGFITRIMVDLISRHNINNKDEFRRALINSEALKLELQQYTGHNNSTSLDTYIDLAFNEITNYKETMSTVMVIRSTELMFEKLMLETEEATFHNTITSDVIDKMQTIIHQFRKSVLMNDED